MLQNLLRAIEVLFLSALVSAVSNVTVVPLTSGCSSYPNYDNTTGIAGPLRLVADSTGTDVDGFKFKPLFAIAVGGGSWGFMVLPTIENKTAEEIPFQCSNDTLQAHLNMGFAGTVWQDLIAAGTPGESVFGFRLPDLPDPNYHLETCALITMNLHLVDGVEQPGVYLGSVNVTNWGFNYQNFTETGEYYYARLLGPNSNNPATGKQLNSGEFAGYIKITAA
ncbi:uncharacterized protein GGS22DRAFT_200343 [Annulohypoxylon maeteangense]|uniref:uncharacterized protein n=1 Tax=Annulohypoxylon maeteangense TaxID=1927788 RepID=UPI002007640B|nr:uncharacterized protein GGS22DRAFT_200343 [Annulohypoxylon maeteangense]KAI0884581.1 hypothetical protein GGS22DRAFT_200343 [Annulohypoxylon maeteangense]